MGVAVAADVEHCVQCAAGWVDTNVVWHVDATSGAVHVDSSGPVMHGPRPHLPELARLVAEQQQQQQHVTARQHRRADAPALVTIHASMHARMMVDNDGSHVHATNVLKLTDVRVWHDALKSNGLFTGLLDQLLLWADTAGVGCGGVWVAYCCNGRLGGYLTAYGPGLQGPRGFWDPVLEGVWFPRMEAPAA
jgi:hypothetical protein